VYRHVLLKLGFVGLGDGQQCILLDRTLQATTHAGHGSCILRYGHWPRSTLLVATIPFRAFVVLHAVHDLVECDTIVEVNFYQLTFLMVVHERFAMLTNVRVGIVRVRSVDEQLPNGGLCPTVLLQ